MRSAAVLAVLIALTAASAASAAPGWLPPVDLSPIGAFSQVAVNPAGDAVAVWQQSDGKNAIVRTASRRAGEPFSGGLDLSAPGVDARGAQVALDEAGNALVVWQRGGVVQATSRPAGGRFSPPVDLSAVGANSHSADLAMDGSGNAIVVWVHGGGGPVKAALRPAGGSFSAPVDISAMGVLVDSPHAAIDTAGGAVAVWRRRGATSVTAAIQHAIRPAGGVFSAPADLSAPSGVANTPQLAMDAAGNAVAVWQQLNGSDLIVEAASRPAGAGFAAPQALSALGRNASSPQVAIGTAGEAVAVWARQRPGPPNAPDEIQAAIRVAGGSFSPPVDLSGGVPGGPSAAPHVAIDAAGNAVVVWRRLNTQGLYRVQAATRPAGASFSRVLDVSAPDVFVLNPRVEMDGGGNALAVWDGFKPGASLVQASVYDATPPRLDGLSVPASGMVGKPVSFSASPFDAWSSVSTTWAFGDGGEGSGAALTHTYTAPGTYRVGITVRDAAGTAVEDAREIAIAPPPAGRAAPAISRLRIAPPAFSRRARVSYRLDRAATVRFRVLRRSRGGRFVALRGGFARASSAGGNRFTLTRRLRGRTLRPGRYRLSAVPAAGGVRGRAARAGFRVVASRARSRAAP